MVRKESVLIWKKTQSIVFLLHKNRGLAYFFFFMKVISSDGSNTRLVTVAVMRVSEVSQPRDCVPPNPLKQKMIKPAIRTKEV
jgi:catabolite regulation protein CreA